MTDFYVIIPARYGSTRFPAKMLADLEGKPMMQWVYERACLSGARDVIIATDDARIATVASEFGAHVCMTANTHTSGTQRLAETAKQLKLSKDTVVVNVQGDEPLVDPRNIIQVAQAVSTYPDAMVTTVCQLINEPERIFDPNIVKVVRDVRDYALYFSRAPIPWHRDAFEGESHHALDEIFDKTAYYQHTGLYAYTVDALDRYISLPVSPLETLESLEQLRVLAHGYKIHVGIAEGPCYWGVDVKEDLMRVCELLKQGCVI